jgi:hypothetical protein
VKDHDELNQHLRVYPGQVIPVGEYKVIVAQIENKTVGLKIENLK